MPVSYELERSQYKLVATVDTKYLRPSVIFTIESTTTENLFLGGKGIDCFLSAEHIREVESRIDGYPLNGLRFTWIPSCVNAKPLPRDDVALNVSILDPNGRTVSIERIPFEIIANGIRREYEGP